MKLNPYGLAIAVLTFVLSMVLMYLISGGRFNMLDGAFPIFEEEEQFQHCHH